jgi:hypothetical protein
MGGELDFVPNKGVGIFEFKTPLIDYVADGSLVREDYPPELGGDEDYVDDSKGISVSADEQGLIEDIFCYEELIFKKTNLIGMKISNVIAILGQEPEEYSEKIEVTEDDFQITAEFDSLGLQLWLRNSVVVSAVISTIFEEAN